MRVLLVAALAAAVLLPSGFYQATAAEPPFTKKHCASLAKEGFTAQQRYDYAITQTLEFIADEKRHSLWLKNAREWRDVAVKVATIYSAFCKP